LNPAGAKDHLIGSYCAWIDSGLRNEVLNLFGNGLVKLVDVMRWAGRDAVPAQPGSPLVRYDANIEKSPV